METRTFKEILTSLEISKIKSNKAADDIIELAKSEGAHVPEVFSSFEEKKEFIKELIVEIASQDEPAPTPEPEPAQEEPDTEPVDEENPAPTKSQSRRMAAQKEEVVKETVQKMYQGHPIITDVPHILHGKTYRRISANGQTFILSMEDYAKDVK